jgi:hypothetical protein
VHRICGILDVNSFEVRGLPSKSGVAERLRGVYLRAALMAHDCVGNTHLAVDDDFQMIIHASLPIPRGQPIYFNYTSTMQVYDHIPIMHHSRDSSGLGAGRSGF